MKPQLADNWLEDKQRLPAWQQPKLDGVRGLYLTDQFTGRSLKPFKNKALTLFWSDPMFKYLDGELILPGSVGNEARMCSLTTGLCNRVKDTEVPDLVAFDYLHPDLIAKGATYQDRYGKLAETVQVLQELFGPSRVRLIPNYPVTHREQVLANDSMFLDDNLEGSILRNHLAPYKEGRPSSKVQELMRIKNFTDFEFIAEGLVEAMENQNVAVTNELGRSERSSHKENKVAKGMVGAIKGRILSDVVHNGKILFHTGHPVLCGPGQMTHAERFDFWAHPEKIIDQINKGKFFAHGIKDKLRMPIWLSLRAAEDMS